MIRREQADGVLTLTIDRQEKKNALTVAMRQELERLPEEIERGRGIRVVVLAATEPIFCAGADLKELAALEEPPLTRPGAGLRAVLTPTIACVGGPCVTGGLELALSCDFILASERARFADTHVKIGVLPRWGMSALLPRRIGLARAKEISLSGRWVEADEAERIGLVNRVVAHERLREETLAVARQIAGNPPAAIRATLDLLDRGEGASATEALALEDEIAGAFVVDRAQLRPAKSEEAGD